MNNQKIIDNIVALVDSSPSQPTAIYLEGGHYENRTGPDKFALSSQEAALDIGKALIKEFGGRNARDKIRLILGHLLGDLGMDCSDSKCTTTPLGKPSDLAPEIEKILSSSGLYKEQLFLTGSERRARNRSASALKHLRHPSLSSRDGKIYYTNDDGREIFIANGNAERKGVIIPHCASIMAAHYTWVYDKVAERFRGDNPRTIIVDFSRIREELTVTTGAEMTLRIFKKAAGDHHFINVFFMDDEGAYSIIKKTSWDEFDE